eukprot:scaffold218318_cov59-Attheya_sp.AAC.1
MHGNGGGRGPPRGRNGYRVKFANPADMNSFAVVDFVGDSNHIPPVLSFLKNQFKVMNNHGIELPENIDPVAAAEDITVQCNSGEFDAVSNTIYLFLSKSAMVLTHKSVCRVIRQCVIRAIDNAKQYFHFDRAGHFRKNNVWFKTLAVNNETGEIAPCLVIPPSDQSDYLSIMLPQEILAPTHQVTWNGGTPTKARLRVKVIIDTHQAKNTDGVWQAAEFCGYIYELPPGSVPQFIDPAECTNGTPILNVSASDIECPSVVFAYLPNDDARTYRILKMVSKFDCGVRSQCVIATKFAEQRNPDQ